MQDLLLFNSDQVDFEAGAVPQQNSNPIQKQLHQHTAPTVASLQHSAIPASQPALMPLSPQSTPPSVLRMLLPPENTSSLTHPLLVTY